MIKLSQFIFQILLQQVRIVNTLNRYQDGGRYEHYQTLTDRKIPLVVLST